MIDLMCPYCSYVFESDTDFDFDENELFKANCPECEKSFIYSIQVEFSSTEFKADCLNGKPHDYKLSHTYPKEFSKMRCSMCGRERELTNEERIWFNIGTKESYFKSREKQQTK